MIFIIFTYLKNSFIVYLHLRLLFNRMKIFKFIFSWQLLVSILLAGGIFFAIGFSSLEYLKSYTKFGEEIDVPKVTHLNIMQATKLLEENNLEYEIDSFKYDPKFKPFQIFSIYPTEGSKVKTGRKLFIRCNPKTWKPVSLPNLIDKSKYLAFSQLEILGLKVGDTLYETNIAQDRVIRMLFKGREIKAGDAVPKFSVIDLVIGLGYAKDVIVPDLIGLDYQSAKKILKQNYFEEGIINFEGAKDTLSSLIYYQEPIPGSKLDQGLSINLWMSKKPREELQEEISKLDKLYNYRVNFDSISMLKKIIPSEENRVLNDVNPKPKTPTKPKSSTSSTPSSSSSSTSTNSQGNDVIE